MQRINIGYTLFLVLVVLFSYFFVDPNFPIPVDSFVRPLTDLNPTIKTGIYTGVVISAFAIYLYLILLVAKQKMPMRTLWFLIIANVLLLVSYPAFSFDIFNYIATAKVTFQYRENPYIVMPIELSNEPMLTFMHAANKTALYGPSWIFLTAVPFFAGFGNLFLTVFSFKLFNFIFYIGTCYLLYELSQKNNFKLILFALNPLVIIETLVSGHNDIVMVFFALLAFHFLNKKLLILSVTAMIFSIFIKYATIILVPIYIFIFIQKITNKNINWQKVWLCCFVLLLVAFSISPIREEMYSWYFIWPFTFLVLVDGLILIKVAACALMFGLLFRFAPFIYFRTWEGVTPIAKIIVTMVPVALSAVLYPIYRKRLK